MLSAILDRSSAPADGGAVSPDRIAARSLQRRLAFGILILSAFYAVGFLDRGWIPHDEGTLGQSAERVVGGQLPHRDFDEPYTGGLTWLHAAAFRWGGIRLLTLRWVLFLFFLPFVAAVHAIASRLAPPLSAAGIALLAVAWSVPNYFASMPSWYNLFLATFGILCLFKHIESGRNRWLFAAGLCGGLSILVKIIGLYYVAGVLLFLLYREQVLSVGSRPADRRSSLFLLFKVALCAMLVALVARLVGVQLELIDALHFVFPSLGVAAVLIWFEFREGAGAAGQRFRRLFRLVVPFAAGAALPVALYLLPYALTDSIPDIVRGVFVVPQRQISKAIVPFPPLSTLKFAIPYAVLLAFPRLVPRRWERWLTAALFGLLAFAIVAASSIPVYEAIWNSARSLDVVAVILGCWILVRRAPDLSEMRRQQLFVLLAVCALVGLVQFPFSAPVYFCYFAPLVALTLFALVFSDSRAPKLIHACILGFYLLFGMIRLNSKYAVIFWDYRPDTVLALQRGGLRIEAAEANAYSALVHLIQETQAGRRLWAGPDCPEVYFLAARPNPTRFFFDFLGGLSGNNAALERMLEEKRITMVVLNRAPHFSAKPTAELYQSLAARFPHSRSIWKFIVLWRD
jgi:hypothetical protein